MNIAHLIIFLACFSSAHSMSEQKNKINGAVCEAAEKNNLTYVKKYLKDVRLYNDATIEEALFYALEKDHTQMVQLLLKYYTGNFYVNSGRMIRTMLNIPLVDFTRKNYTAKINNILQLIESGASPLETERYQTYNTFLSWFEMIIKVEESLNDKKILKAIQEFPAKRDKREMIKKEYRDRTLMTLCPRFLGGAIVLVDIIHDYLGVSYILDEDEPKALRWHSEK